jgi:hypothetical protein
VADGGVPETDLARVQTWCRRRVPEHVQGQVRVECDVEVRQLTIYECRPPWRPDIGPEWTRMPIARLRYTKARRTWSLYWRDRNLRWHAYQHAAATGTVQTLLEEIERDPTGIFWG